MHNVCNYQCTVNVAIFQLSGSIV